MGDEACVDLHHARVEALLVGAQAVPRGDVGVGRRQLGVGRDDAHLLLTLEDDAPVLVPAHVELAVVLLDPLTGRMVRRLAGGGGVVEQERLVGRVDVRVEDEADGVVDRVLVEVVALLGRLLGLDRVVVVDELGIPAAALAAEPAVEALEAASERPAVEGPGRRAVLGGRDVPLAADEGVVALGLEDLRDHPVLERHARISAGIAGGDLGDGRDVVRVVVAAREDAGARGRAEGRRVHVRVTQAAFGEAVEGRRLDEPAEGAGLPVADVVEHEEDHVRGALGSARHLRPRGARLRDRAADLAPEGGTRLVLDDRHQPRRRARRFMPATETGESGRPKGSMNTETSSPLAGRLPSSMSTV